MMVKDGKGRGTSAGVNKRNQLEILSFAHNGAVDYNVNGRSFATYVEVTPGGAGQEFLYLGNTGSVDIRLHQIRGSAASAETVNVYVGATSTVSGGTAGTPRGLNRGRVTAAEVDYQTGTNITSTDSNAVQLGTLGLTTALKVDTFEFPTEIILSPGTALILNVVTGSVAIKVTTVWSMEYAD